MSKAIVCDSCGAILHLPTTPESSEGWQRLSGNTEDGLVFKHVCGRCDPTPVIKSLEDRR